jgi:putative phage-type endonuclease
MLKIYWKRNGDMEQRTEEWHQARLGKVTASRVADVMAKTKAGYGASRANYMAELIVERLTGRPGDSFQSPAMTWGTNTEPLARAAYEAHKGVLVEEVGFVPHPTIPMAGASPDGLVDMDGLVEIKCPNTATHIETLMTGNVPLKYVLQMHWQMICTGREWCDFVSFDPRMPEGMQLFVAKYLYSNDTASDLIKEVTAFLKELDDKVSSLKEKYGNGL